MDEINQYMHHTSYTKITHYKSRSRNTNTVLSGNLKPLEIEKVKDEIKQIRMCLNLNELDLPVGPIIRIFFGMTCSIENDSFEEIGFKEQQTENCPGKF